MTVFLGSHLAWADAVGYRITDLGEPTDYSSSLGVEATSINNAGQVAVKVFYHSYVWQNGVFTPVPALPGSPHCTVRAINESGAVAGTSTVLTDGWWLYRAITSSGGVTTELGRLNGLLVEAYGINGVGDAVGYSTYKPKAAAGAVTPKTLTGPFDPMVACLFRDGEARPLFPLNPGQSSQATAINNQGEIVGWLSGGEARFMGAFVYRDGEITFLNDPTTQSAEPTDINDAGWIVGGANFHLSPTRGLSNKHAFLYRNGAMEDLGVLPGRDDGSEALAINASGQVVGMSYWNAYLDPRPFLYEDGKMHDLLSQIAGVERWGYIRVVDINDEGTILCFGRRKTENPNLTLARSFLLTRETIPSPTIQLAGGRPRLTTRRAAITLAGQTGGEVTRVAYYLNRRTPARAAHRAGPRWKFTAPLRPGRNVLTVFARGFGGTTATKVTVYRR